MANLKSYYNASLSIPPKSGLSFQSFTNNSVAFISNPTTISTYSMVLPITQGTIKQIIGVGNTFNLSGLVANY